MRPNGLPQEIAAALTEEMERAITGTTEEEAEVDSEPVHGSEEEQTVDAVPHLARPEFRFGQLRPGFPMTRTGFRREEQTQNVATGS
jgi:hypothetical protein